MEDQQEQLQAYGDEGFNYPPGYGFNPFEHELVVDYLMPKIYGLNVPPKVIHEVESFKFSPDELAARFQPQHKSRTWYFFTRGDGKCKKGSRHQVEKDGYWRVYANDKAVKDGNDVKVGFRKHLMFYRGKPPKGVKTNWIMHEYRLHNPPNRDNDARLEDWVLCSIYSKAEAEDTAIPPHSDYEDNVHFTSQVSSDVLPTISPHYNNMYGGNLSLQETGMPPFNTSDTASSYQSPQSMGRGNEIPAVHFTSQVSLDVLPKETAISPHYNNMYAGNLSLQETGMPPFNTYDTASSYQSPQSMGRGNEIPAGHFSSQLYNALPNETAIFPHNNNRSLQAPGIPQFNSYAYDNASSFQNIGDYDGRTPQRQNPQTLPAVPQFRYHPYGQISTLSSQMIPPALPSPNRQIQVSNVPPTETAIFPDYNNNIMYGNLSLQETVMPPFNLYDTAPTSQNNQGDMRGAGNESWVQYEDRQFSAQVSSNCSSTQASGIPQLNSYGYDTASSSSWKNNIGGYDDNSRRTPQRQNPQTLPAVPQFRYHPYGQISTPPSQIIPPALPSPNRQIQVSNVLATETAIFPDYDNNIMYSNLSRQETGMPPFTLYDTAPTCRNNQGDMRGAGTETRTEYEDNIRHSNNCSSIQASGIPQLNSYGYDTVSSSAWQNNIGGLGYDDNSTRTSPYRQNNPQSLSAVVPHSRLMQISTAASQMIPPALPSPPGSQTHAFQNPVYQFPAEAMMAKPPGSPTSQTSENQDHRN